MKLWKLCCEYLRGLRYKLRMMGIPIIGPVYIYGDNQSVLCNTSNPEFQLKKKSQSIAYHFIREGCSRDEWRTAYVSTHENESDLMAKLLPHGPKRMEFVNRMLHHVYRSWPTWKSTAFCQMRMSLQELTDLKVNRILPNAYESNPFLFLSWWM